MTIDPALGITVIEFLSTTGAVENSIPSQHQLDAYRQAQAEQTSHAASPQPSPTAASG
jgi:hypothetical protein